MMVDGLKDKHRQAVIETIAANSRVEKAVLFGSRAMGTFTPESDVDIALFGDDLTLTDQAKLAAEIDRLTIPQKVDLLRYNTITSKKLLKHIREHGVGLYETVPSSVENKMRPGIVSKGSWRDTTIGDISIAICDGPHATPKKTTEGPIFLGISSLENGRLDLSKTAHLSEEDFAKWTRRTTPQENDIVFSYETRLGEAARIPAGLRCCLGRRMALIRPDLDKIDPRFLLYVYLSPSFQQVIDERTVLGSTVNRIPLLGMPSFPIRIPSLPEQQSIAAILGTLDDKIELNRRMSRTLEEIARAIFKSWFVDFDPVRAKAEGRDTGLPKEIANLFPDAFQDSELGEIPQGWAVRALPDLMDVNPTRVLRKGTVATYLAMADMPTRGPFPESWIQREMGSGMKFVNGDTLVARITPCLENGKTAFVDFLNDEEVGWGSTEYIVLRPKDGIPNLFAYLLARTDDFRSFAIQRMTGSSGRQRVPAASLDRYEIAAPDLDSPLFEQFGRIVSPLFDRMSTAMSQSRSLAAIRDILLPRLISGELRLPDAQRIIERTA